MGKKGDKRTGAARREAEAAAAALSGLGGVTTKGMFGGYGLFRDGVMFALVNSAGMLHFRVGPDSRARYEALDAASHGRMPYFAVPEAVRQDAVALLEWATEAAAIATAAEIS